jgi:predicted RNA-binding protein with PUA-like domain
MKVGELAFFYHSNIGKEIVGIMKVVKLAHPDSTAEPNDKGKVVWECVDVVGVEALPKPVTLDDVKHIPGLENMALIKLSRLSVQPVTPEEWEIVCKTAGMKKVPKA